MIVVEAPTEQCWPSTEVRIVLLSETDVWDPMSVFGPMLHVLHTQMHEGRKRIRVGLVVG